MLKRAIALTMLLMTCAAAATAMPQQPETKPGQVPASVPDRTAAGRRGDEMANVRLELTISVLDAKGGAVVPVKSVTLHVVDRDTGRIRMGRSNPATPDNSPMLSVDASPHIYGSGRIRVNLTFEYHPASDAKAVDPLHVNERLSAVLDDGKLVVISQTGDPATDRQVKVELKATILK
jgi:hypothetical protein